MLLTQLHTQKALSMEKVISSAPSPEKHLGRRVMQEYIGV